MHSQGPAEADLVRHAFFMVLMMVEHNPPASSCLYQPGTPTAILAGLDDRTSGVLHRGMQYHPLEFNDKN